MSSPKCNTKWDEIYAPALGRLTYSLRAPSLNGKQGVYASTVCEAWRYMDDDCRLFVVAPDPDAETEVGIKGWRTTCAIVLGEAISLHDAASLILASRQAGYPQIRGILRWARSMQVMPRKGLTARDLVEESIEVHRMVRAAAWGYYATIRRGRSEHTAGVTWSTPIRVIKGDEPPVLVGEPYLKTHFSKGRFSRTLYTPSTLCIEVGEDWPPLRSLCQMSQAKPPLCLVRVASARAPQPRLRPPAVTPSAAGARAKSKSPRAPWCTPGAASQAEKHSCGRSKRSRRSWKGGRDDQSRQALAAAGQRS